MLLRRPDRRALGATRRAIDSGWAAWYLWSDSTEPDGRHPDSWPDTAPQRRSRGGPMRTFPLLRTVVAAALVSVALASGVSALEVGGLLPALEVGQQAPDFALNGVDGKPVKLSDLTAKGPVVIYTFIAAFTPT